MFRVKWKQQALNQLAAIWVNATDRNAVTAASHAIDQALRNDPEQEGESRPGNYRVTYVSPLGVRFRVYPDRQLVRVLACWQIRPV